MTRSLLLSLFALAAIVPGSAQAQDFKGKTIIEIVNYPAGGPTDIEGRIVAQHLPGLKEVETAILQNTGQMANTSLSGWIGSAEPALGNLVIPIWQLTPRDVNGGYPRSANLPNLQTFEEFYAGVKGSPPPADDIRYRALRTMIDPQLAMFRMALLPPKTPADMVATMRKAFQEMWADKAFLADYARVMKTEPILIRGDEGQKLLAAIGTVPKPIKDFLVDYSTRMTSK